MNYYETLGVADDASEAAIRTAYRRLVLLYHPDISVTGSAEKFRRVQEAYETLGEGSRRHAYDRSLHNQPRRIPVTVIHGGGTPAYAEPLAGPPRNVRGSAFSEFDQFLTQLLRCFEADWF